MAAAESNLEIVRAALLAQNRKDDEAFVAAMHPDVEWITGPNPFGFPEMLHGQRQILDVAQAARKRYGTLTLTLHDLREAGDQVLALGSLSAGRRLTMPRAWIWTMSDGKARTIRSFSSQEAAIKAFEGRRR